MRSASGKDHRVVLVPHSDIYRKKQVREIISKTGVVPHIQYVLGIFGRTKEEVTFFKNDLFSGGEAPDLSLYNSKVI